MKDIKIVFTNERIIPASRLAVVGAILGKSDFMKRCNRMDVTPNRSQHQIKNGDILLTYIDMLCMGNPQYGAVHEMGDNQEFYKYALGITHNISDLREYNTNLARIGNILNQIAKRANASGNIYSDDIKEVKELMKKIWHTQKSMLSRQPSVKQ